MRGQKNMLVAGASLCGLAVVLGAFGAHWLADRLAPQQLQSFETGVRYQMYHGLAILVLSMSPFLSWSSVRWVARFWLAGVLMFSVSIYILATRDLLQTQSFAHFFGPVTPLGGLLMIAGWINLVIAALKK
jgi:uncharacterized membrane protein YgdD (TMEM256/DUF423 family)